MERLTWVKSSLSFSNGNCVEVAHLPGGHIGLRDSKNPEGPVLRFTTDEWNAFLGGARNGEFDGFGKELSLTARRRSVLSWLTASVITGEGPPRAEGPSPFARQGERRPADGRGEAHGLPGPDQVTVTEHEPLLVLGTRKRWPAGHHDALVSQNTL